jgi:RND family efflux transporter MFP subunit
MDNPTPQTAKLPTWVKPIAVIGVIGVIAAILSPFLSASLAPVNDDPKLTHTIRRGDLAVTVTENGTVESSNNKEIKCLVKGGSTVLWVIETGTLVQPGEELVKLDTSTIEEKITQQTILVERAVANEIIEQANVEVAKTNIEEYLNGTYLEERATIEKDIFDAEEQFKKTQLAYASAQRMASKGILRSLQLDGEKFAVESARKALELKQQQLKTLENYKKKKSLQELQAALAAAEARLAAEAATVKLEKDRLAREEEQLTNCIITADTEGMVIFPSAAEWKGTPDIEEGAVVREQQTLLMIPDVSKMQVKVGIHESKVDQLEIGMPATVQLQDLTLEGEVSEIATVTRPAGWWTGNMVKYDTLIRLQQRPGLKPGMSAVVDVVLETYEDELLIPVAAILEGDDGYVCWVQTAGGIQRREIELGGSNDEFTVVNAGLAEGDKVVLNPLAFIDEAQKAALRPAGSFRKQEATEAAEADEAKVAKPADKKTEDQAAGQEKKSAAAQRTRATLLNMADKNTAGVLTEVELDEQKRAMVGKVDTTGDGPIDVAALHPQTKAASG